MMMNDELSSLMQVKLEPPETLDLSKNCHQRLDDQDVFSSQDSNDYSDLDDQSNLEYPSYDSPLQHSYYNDNADSPIDIRTSIGTSDYFGENLSLNQGPDRPGSPRRCCLVCADTASGLHYGVASCEACKAFFKRTVQGNIEYACPAFGNCEITKRRRKACQACRFQKCLSVGMLKEGVRLDRVRGGRQKYRRLDNSTPTGIAATLQPPQKKSFPSCAEFLKSLMAIEPEKVYALPDETLPNSNLKLMTTLSDLADRELVATIGWAKQVPGFLTLPLPDQMNLLQSTWLDILCFNECYRSVPYNGTLVFADDLKCSEVESKRLGIPPELDSVSRRLAAKMSLVSVTREEYLFLKTIILLNPDVTSKHSERVQQLRDSVQDALLEHLAALNPSSLISANRRVCELLFLFPMLMQMKIHAKNFWFSVKRTGRVTLHKLLNEMLEFMSV